MFILELFLINRQMSSESSASGSISSGQQVVYKANCGKTGGFDVAVLHEHMLYILPQSSAGESYSSLPQCHCHGSDYSRHSGHSPLRTDKRNSIFLSYSFFLRHSMLQCIALFKLRLTVKHSCNLVTRVNFD